MNSAKSGHGPGSRRTYLPSFQISAAASRTAGNVSIARRAAPRMARIVVRNFSEIGAAVSSAPSNHSAAAGVHAPVVSLP